MIELWQAVVGALVTAGLTGMLTFIAAWVAVQRRLAALEQRMGSLENHVHRDLRARVDGLENRCSKQDDRMQAIEQHAAKAIYNEEFQAFTGQTSATLNRLAETVGRLRGALDEWGKK